MNIELLSKLLKVAIEAGPYDTTIVKRQAVPRDLYNEIFERDGWACQICANSTTHAYFRVHHIAPMGPSVPDNLILLCKRCHDAIHGLLRQDGLSGPPRDIYPPCSPLQYELEEWKRLKNKDGL